MGNDKIPVTISSDQVSITHSAQTIFDFLRDFNNFKRLMPLNKISNWASNSEEGAFKINGIATIGMKFLGNEECKEIHFTSSDKSAFEFDLHIVIKEEKQGNTQVQFIYKAMMIPVVKLLAEKPLGAFFNTLAENLKKIQLPVKTEVKSSHEFL